MYRERRKVRRLLQTQHIGERRYRLDGESSVVVRDYEAVAEGPKGGDVQLYRWRRRRRKASEFSQHLAGHRTGFRLEKISFQSKFTTNRIALDAGMNTEPPTSSRRPRPAGKWPPL